MNDPALSVRIPHVKWDRAPWNPRTLHRIRQCVATAQVRITLLEHSGGECHYDS